MKILLVDNYDSFTYNLYQQVWTLAPNAGLTVLRNDALRLEEVGSLKPDGIILSPGPGGPTDTGICIPLIEEFGGKIPMLGVCLGHQAIAFAYGAGIVKASLPLHGKTSLITHTGTGLFAGVPSESRVARYHSLCIATDTLPSHFEVSAMSDDNVIMAISHKELPMWGIQFHPESFMTEHGSIIMQNFLKEIEHAKN